jgi:hypothetical protein
MCKKQTLILGWLALFCFRIFIILALYIVVYYLIAAFLLLIVSILLFIKYSNFNIDEDKKKYDFSNEISTEKNKVIDLNKLTGTRENMKFTKDYQLKIVYYTMLVYFGIGFLALKTYIPTEISFLLNIFFLPLLFITYFFIIFECRNKLKLNRYAIAKTEFLYYDLVRRDKIIKNLKKNNQNTIDNSFLFAYISIGFLGLIFAELAVLLN